MFDPIAELEAHAAASTGGRAEGTRTSKRRHLGIETAEVYALADAWREGRSIGERVAMAAALWDSNIHEARLAAAKLLTQARIRDDELLVWNEFLRWVPTFDDTGLADHACKVGERRLLAVPERIEEVEGWTRAPSSWTRRAALMVTLPWAKFTHPSPQQVVERERVLHWVAAARLDADQAVRQAALAWVRSLAKHDPGRADALRAAAHGA